MLNVALPKGRLADTALDRMAKAGYEGAALVKGSRKLVIDDPAGGIRYFLVKPSDVGTYVLYGAADIGVVGKDILLETKPDVYELLDLGFGACRIIVAGPAGAVPPSGIIRVATKYPEIAKRHYAEQSRDIELIILNGSIELAPIVGLSDVIVDIVETGSTLRDNNLVILEEIMPVSARLIANIAASKFKAAEIDAAVAALKKEGTP